MCMFYNKYVCEFIKMRKEYNIFLKDLFLFPEFSLVFTHQQYCHFLEGNFLARLSFDEL